MLELGLVALVCALAAGAVVGSGLAQTVLATPNPLTWLRNAKGQVVQVNPETGTMVQRLQIGDAGDELRVVQDGSRLVVTNPDGTVTIVDLSMLRVAGVRQGDAAAVKVLLADGRIFLVNKARGEIETLDPLTAAPVGQPYQAGGPLTDAVADSTNALWALGTGGRLATLRWTETTRTFTEQQRRDLPGAGPDTVLVGHQQGVTAVSTTGQAIQVGTGQDRTVQVGNLTPPLAAAELSPADLVPVSATQTGNVHLVRDNGPVTVDGPPLGCRNPDKPAVYRNRVYVPCPGDRKVIILDQDGQRAEPDLTTQGDAELVLNAGLLFVNVPTGKTSLVVKPDGTTQPITTDDPNITVNDPDARPTALPDGLGLRPAKPPQPPARQGQNPSRPPATKRPAQQPATRPQPNPDRPDTPTTQANPTTGPDGTTPTPSTTGTSPDPDRSLDPSPSTDPTGDATTDPTGDPTPDEPPPTSDPPPPTGPAPRPEDFTPTNVRAAARSDGQVDVAWTAPPNTPASYRILRADAPEPPLVTGLGGGATSAIVGGLTPGEQVSFIVEAGYDDGTSYPSGASEPITAFGQPGSPTVTLELVARTTRSLTLRTTVTVVNNGGNPVTGYDLTLTASSGQVQPPALQGIPLDDQPRQFTIACDNNGQLCMAGGTVTARATLTNAAGAGPEGTAQSSIPAPAGFAFGQAFMYVSTGGKCLDVSLTLRTCNGSAAHLWVHEADRRAIRNQSTGGCLAVNDRIHLARDGCTDDPKKWTRVNPAGNEALLFASIGGECVRIVGSPDQEGASVSDPKNCTNAPTERWTAWRPPPDVPVAAPAAQPASFTPSTTQDSTQAGLGEAPTLALLLLPLAAGLVRNQQRRRHRR
jgi:hypothetical protein